MPIDIITTTTPQHSPDFIQIWVGKCYKKQFMMKNEVRWLVGSSLSYEAKPDNHDELVSIFISVKTLDEITRKTIRRIR